jgi:hypothetical protein
MKNTGFKTMCAFVCAFCLFTLNIGNVQAQTDGNADNRKNISFNLYSILNGAGAYYIEQSEFKGGFDAWVNARIDGKVGKSISFFADIGVALLYAERRDLGEWDIKVGSTEKARVYSQPLAYFPYSYQSPWGGFIFPLNALDSAGPAGWPDYPAIGFDITSEIAGSLFDRVVEWSIGRIEREAAAPAEGYSLALNKAAQPFLAYDLQLNLLPGLSIYSLAGILEYFASAAGIYSSSSTFQNGFSLFNISYNFRDYVYIDVGSSVIWPKRFEMGYLYPFTIPILYKNIGEYDNMTMFGNLKLQYPDVGFVWFSLFVDEMSFEGSFFNLDREMYAFQAGARYFIPSLSSASITVSYTKIEPYCYTHQKEKTPWYDQPMEQAYLNHGYNLGYYLPPNSDEIKVAFTVMPASRVAVNAEFQMIRHGADYGSGMVDGSSFLSELKGEGRNTDPSLQKYFLHDGAYQWLYIVKAGAKWDLGGLPFPLSLYGDAGAVFSYYTDIEPGKNNSGQSYPYSIIDTSEYPKSTGIIINLGIKASLR